MLQKSARPAGEGPNRAGFDDFRVAAEIEAGNTEILVIRQAADRRLRRQRAVERVHRLGARVVFELLDDLARSYPEIADELDEQLARFVRLEPDILAALGGDRFALPPTRLVGASRK
jgi:hypothetical protein